MKKFIALLLPVIMILSFVACGDSNNTASGGTTSPNQSDTSETVKQGPPTFEKTDYGNRTFTVAWPDLSINENYYFSEGTTGDILNDAVYDRLTKVEEQLNITIAEYCLGQCNDVYPLLQKVVLSGLEDYDLVLYNESAQMGTFIGENLVYDWNTINYIDLSQDYWHHDINANMSFYGKQLAVSNAWNIPWFISILHNKTMVTDYQLEDPYELVRSGKWTIDKMTELAKQVAKDLNGDGKYDLDDQYGFGTSMDYHMKAFLVGFDQKIVKKNADQTMEYDFMNEKMVTIVEKMYKLIFDDNASLTWTYGTFQGGIIVPIFDEGRMLFLNQIMAWAENYRQADVEYGILPHPKFNETQDKYRIFHFACYNVIPTTIQDTDLCGKVLELLGWWGYNSVVPAYKEVLLTEKVSRDNESAETLDLIFNNFSFDLANAFGYMEILYFLMNAKTTDINSWYAKEMPAHQKTLDNNNEAILNFGK